MTRSRCEASMFKRAMFWIDTTFGSLPFMLLILFSIWAVFFL